MCGDIESESPLEQVIIERFRAVADRYLAVAGTNAGQDPEHDYMDDLFATVLRKCADDIAGVENGGALAQLQAQGVVLARLAGILAGQLPPTAETLQASMDALLVGYREARSAAGDDHAHDHGHHHH